MKKIVTLFLVLGVFLAGCSSVPSDIESEDVTEAVNSKFVTEYSYEGYHTFFKHKKEGESKLVATGLFGLGETFDELQADKDFIYLDTGSRLYEVDTKAIKERIHEEIIPIGIVGGHLIFQDISEAAMQSSDIFTIKTYTIEDENLFVIENGEVQAISYVGSDAYVSSRKVTTNEAGENIVDNHLIRISSQGEITDFGSIESYVLSPVANSMKVDHVEVVAVGENIYITGSTTFFKLIDNELVEVNSNVGSATVLGSNVVSDGEFLYGVTIDENIEHLNQKLVKWDAEWNEVKSNDITALQDEKIFTFYSMNDLHIKEGKLYGFAQQPVVGGMMMKNVLYGIETDLSTFETKEQDLTEIIPHQDTAEIFYITL